MRDVDALTYLIGIVGWPTVASVGGLMVLASLTEGIGLLLLVPITRIIANQDAAGPIEGRVGDWGAMLTTMPLWLLLGGFVAIIALRAALTYAVLMRRATLSLSLVRQLRTTAHSALIAGDWRWLSGQRSADHAALIITQSEQVGREADRAVDLASALVTLIALLVAAMWVAWQLTLVTLLVGTLTALVRFGLRRQSYALGGPFAAAYKALQGHVIDGLTHLRAARLAGAEDALARDFKATAESIEQIERRYLATGYRAQLGLQVIAATMLALLVWFGLRILSLPLALFVPVLAIFARIVPLIASMQQGWRAWRFCRPALENLRATVAAARAAAEPVVANVRPIVFARDITFEHVDITLAGRHQPILENFCCQIEAGSVVGVCGPSGSGKSTLADLISGLIAPDRGAIRVDGLALEGERRIRWRRQVAYVEQVPYLFDGTIAANLAWGASNPDRAVMERALHEASAEFVFNLPRGVETAVGEVGRHLSGGERQRISLARALMRKPSLIILDEVTAALDSLNEATITRTIEQLRHTCTFVILGHRPALHELADKVIELRCSA